MPSGGNPQRTHPGRPEMQTDTVRRQFVDVNSFTLIRSAHRIRPYKRGVIMRRAAFLAPTALVLVLSGPAYADTPAPDAPPSGAVTAPTVTANGSGCPAGT